MEGEEEEMARRRVMVERALAEDEEMERRRVRAVRLLGTSPSSGLAAGYLAWVASGYSREFLCRALGDGVSASQWTVAAMDLATPGAWTQPEVFQGVDHLGDIVAAQLGQVSEDVEDAFAVAHGFMGRASDLPQGIMAFIRRSDAAVPAGRAAVQLCVRSAVDAGSAPARVRDVPYSVGGRSQACAGAVAPRLLAGGVVFAALRPERFCCWAWAGVLGGRAEWRVVLC